MAESNSPTSSQLELPESPSQIIGRRRKHLVSIIKQNDRSPPRQFIASCSPEDVIAPGTLYLEDTLFSAASYGSPETLRILLGVYTAAPEIVKSSIPISTCCSTHVVQQILMSYVSSWTAMTIQRIRYRSDRWICIREMTPEIRRFSPLRGR